MAEDGLQRLQNDLNVVMEKVQLCREIMLVSPGIAEDETLAGVIGFLEACRDRYELIHWNQDPIHSTSLKPPSFFCNSGWAILLKPVPKDNLAKKYLNDA